ncbi:MAG: hypothetical protein HFE43_07880 [Oscillospiraceae bacterium]|nr:hypothetical protein [Oscillospiraceae bacterium]
MSRFVQEISGELGDYWKRSAEKELAKAQAELDSGAITIDQHGVARNCIGRVLMDDMLEKVMMLTDKVSKAATQAARAAETEAGWKPTGSAKALPTPRSSLKCGRRSTRGLWWRM